MSEFILNKIEPVAKQTECNLDNKEMIEERISSTEQKINEIKFKMDKRKPRSKIIVL